jgi:DNA-binding NtrC family response regulator
VRDLQLTPAAIVRLKAHSWPGNIRELENAMLRLAVMANVPEIGVEDIEMHALGSAREMQQGPLPTIQLRELESLAIDEAMRRFAGNKRKAAEALGVALKTLYNKLNAAAPDAVDED